MHSALRMEAGLALRTEIALDFVTMDTKVVFLHGFTQDEAVALIRVVKSSPALTGDTAFAMSTATNLEWKVADLVEHVAEEHAEMKRLNPRRT